MKLWQVAWVNFTNILWTAYVPIFLHRKGSTLKCKYKKLSHEKPACKMLVKLTPVFYNLRLHTPGVKFTDSFEQMAIAQIQIKNV
jgi:hypothetical protein